MERHVQSRVLTREEMLEAIDWYFSHCPISIATHTCHVANDYECERHRSNIQHNRAHSQPKSAVGSLYLRSTRLVLDLWLVEEEQVLFKLTWG